MLLPGEVARSLQIPLSPTDFVREELVVSISLQGEGPDSQCSRDDGLAAIVEIETTSAVFLTLDRPLETARDRVNAWGRIVRVAWPDWLDSQERVRRLALATQFKQHDVETVVLNSSANALTTTQLRAILPMFSEQEDQDPASWPRSLAQAGANAGLRRFHHETSWRYRYDLHREDGLKLPANLDLDMVFGRQLPGTHWLLTATLNNRLLHQEIFDGAQTTYTRLIPLPAELQSASNIIEIVASTTRRDTGRCDQGPVLIAEMLPTTHLLAGDANYSDQLTEIRHAISEAGVLGLGVAGVLSAADADAVSSLLAQLVPTSVTLKPDPDIAKVVVIPPQSPGFPLDQTGPIWLVTLDTVTQRPHVNRLEPGAQLPRRGLAVLVTPDAMDVTEVAR
ncbi:hypothetical protein QTO30_04440 [Yoonia sp. GPGPB17]|uniref:hypothetical protein n=1 Tax=Yoonia sp. GPGPB17 TaxID=3026147 RepID=UPI0030C40CAB